MLAMVIVSIVAVGEAIALVILVAVVAGRGSSPAATAADAPRPVAPVSAAKEVPVVDPGKKAPAARGKRGERVESAGFGITVEKVEYEPTYKDIARVGAEQRYLALLILAENSTGGNAGFFPSMFRLQDEKGFEYEPLALKVKVPGLEWRTMGNREKVRGYIDFVVPKSAKGLTLVYSHVPRQGSQPIRVELGE